MRSNLVPGLALLAGLGAGDPASAQQHGAAAPNITKPNMVLQQVVEGLPTDDKQTVRVMTATFKPGDKTVYVVHDRLGEPCPQCGTPIARVDFEEHTIYYCPSCQTGGRILKDRRLSRLLR